MSDLISRKDAVNVAKGFTFTNETQKRQYMDFLHYCLDTTPIAYDLGKVVSELEELLKFIKAENKEAIEYHDGIMTIATRNQIIAYNKAIEIVKRGVSNENN